MNNAIVREQYIALREAWQNKDFGLALKRAFSLLNDQPDHASALKIRLRAALKIPDAAGVAQFAPPVAAFDLSLALLAASKLAAWRDDVAAAEVYVSALASNQLPSAPAKIQASVNSQSRAHVKTLLERGDEALGTGDVSAALRLWQAGIRLSPRHSALRKRIKGVRDSLVAAARKIETTQPDAAPAAWERVLEADPLHATALKNLALGCEAAGDFRKAVTRWTALTQVDVERKRAVSRLVRASSKAHCEFDVLQYLHRAKLTDVVAPEALNHLVRNLVHSARIFMQQRSAVSAAPTLVLLQEAGLPDPALPEAVQRCEKLLFRQMWEARKKDEWDVAVVLARHLSALNPEQPYALEILGRYAIKQRAFSDAIDYFRHLTVVEPSSRKAWRWLAQALRKSGDGQAAAEALAHADSLPAEGRTSPDLAADSTF